MNLDIMLKNVEKEGLLPKKKKIKKIKKKKKFHFQFLKKKEVNALNQKKKYRFFFDFLLDFFFNLLII